jgi:hypothetical protein
MDVEVEIVRSATDEVVKAFDGAGTEKPRDSRVYRLGEHQ